MGMAQRQTATAMVAQMVLPSRTTRTAKRPQFQCLYQASRQRLQAYRDARQFSTTTAFQVVGGSASAFRKEDRRQAKGYSSPKLQQQDALAKNQHLPSDLGLVPQTFITPTGANLPSLVHNFRQRLRLEYWRWRSKVYNLGLSLHYKWFIRTNEHKKTTPKIILNYPFQTGKLASVAEEMHKSMYTAFAAGDMATLNSMCADGILSQLRTRLSRRPASETVEWHCERASKPKLVSHRCTWLPFKAPDGSTAAIRQAVIRLRTRQSLKRTTTHTQASRTSFQRNLQNLSPKRGRSAAAPNTTTKAKDDEVVVNEGEPREVTEYFVIQRRLWKGEEEPWQVWGMTEETSERKLHDMIEEMKLMKGTKRDQAMDSINSVVGAKT